MRALRNIILMLSIFLVATALFAMNEPFQTDREAYQIGYDEGFQHGRLDRQMGFNFDFKHNHDPQLSVSYFSFVNMNFRTGYAEGYENGYNSATSSPTRVIERFSSDEGLVYVTLFTQSSFHGAARQLGAGSYPELAGMWSHAVNSIDINGPVRVVLFDQPNFQGQRLILEEDTSDLDAFNFGSRAASMIIEPLK